jgi:hypothetical protein
MHGEPIRCRALSSLRSTELAPGFSEHAARYDHFFRHLAAAPSSLHIFAFDQRGYGRTGHEPLGPDSPEVKQWKAEGRTVKHEKSPKRKSGGWAKALPDAEFFVRREHDRAKGKKVFLWGHSMVSVSDWPWGLLLLQRVFAYGMLCRAADKLSHLRPVRIPRRARTLSLCSRVSLGAGPVYGSPRPNHG